MTRLGGGVFLGLKFEDIISVENLLLAWSEFIKGKRHKQDVIEFQLHLMDHIFDLHYSLKAKTYLHGHYEHFKINDPKPRDIHKASVRDRLLHHAIYRVLYPYFDKKFISDSFSCRVGKGTHKALDCFRDFAFKVSKNHTRTAWVLKCDIRKFFASIDHDILKCIINHHMEDNESRWLLERIIDSHSPGLPLGNLTSQLLVNIYMNEFDQWVKHELKIKHYIRYADDFVLFHDRDRLRSLVPLIQDFLYQQLKLTLHPTKCFIKTFASGMDFLGWVHFTDHRVMRTGTRRRMLARMSEANLVSYAGLLKWGNTRKILSSLDFFIELA